ncbi:MAG: ParB/RepB/Spo0J family partition protein [Bacteroidetes bacterium]|nr:ParB/RepB/Spo0J family partition protein [Bacteroidota bacterium]
MNAKKRTGLGRGLSALLEGADDEVTTNAVFSDKSIGWSQGNIPLEDIGSNPFQPRTDFEEQALMELADSIREQGIIQPITVRKTGENKYQLISGERRLRAASAAGLTSIPAFIRVADDNQMLELALVENIQRKDLNAIEVAISFQRLIEELEYSQDTLAEKVGKNRSTITNFLRLLKLPPDIQIALRDNLISMGHARALINLEDEETQLAILKNILSKQLSVREVEKIVQDINKPAAPVKKSTSPLPENLAAAKNRLEKKLGGKILVKRNSKGKGNIVLPFNSDTQLEDILQSLV